MKFARALSLPFVLLLIAGCSNEIPGTEASASEEQKAPAAEVLVKKEDREKANFPETDIFIFDLDLDNAKTALSNSRNVTNRPGYDNQPYFTANSDTFLYSRSDDYQTDIYEYDLNTDKHNQLTTTDKSEFSPTPSPNNRQITFVFERNNSIWHIKRGDEDNPMWTMKTPNIEEPVGYFARNHKTGDVLYWSRYGFNVSLTNTGKETYHYVSGNAVPSTPHIIPGTDNFSFVHRQANGDVWIKELNPTTKAVRPLTRTLGSNANYGWAPDGSILMIQDDKLYRNDLVSSRNTDTSWSEVADLSLFGITNANRVSISPNGTKLAIVGVPSKN